MSHTNTLPINVISLTVSAMTLLSACAMAQTTDNYPSAQASDPAKMGWMQGFPPPKDKVLSAADGSFFKFPALRYSVVHMREFLPTVDVSPGLGTPSSLPVALDTGIDAVTFRPWNARQAMSWA